MKHLIQKLAQLIDNEPRGRKKSEVIKDYLELKVNNNKELYLELKNKYQL